MKKLTLTVSLLMAGLLVFSGCGTKDTDQSQTDGTPPVSDSTDGAKNDDTRLSKSFADVMNSKNYTIEYKSMVDMGDGKEVEMETTMAVKGDRSCPRIRCKGAAYICSCPCPHGWWKSRGFDFWSGTLYP